MRNQVLIRRYIQGLVHAVDGEKEYAEIHENLAAVKKVLDEQPRLLEILQSPFFSLSRRTSLALEIITKMFKIEPPPEKPSIEAAAPEFYPPAQDDLSTEAKTARFLLLLIEHDRMPLFPKILEGLPAAWNEEQGISTFSVVSASLLNESQKVRLTEKLERLEKKPVALNYSMDPGIIGGLLIRKGNIVYDVSVAGSLRRIQERIIEE